MKNYSKKMEWNTKKQKKWKLRLKEVQKKLKINQNNPRTVIFLTKNFSSRIHIT